MRDLYIKNGHGFIVMYSLTNHQTFQDITTMRNVISRVKGSQPTPILLVANKLDLECQREVSTEEGESEKLIHWDSHLTRHSPWRSRTGRDVGLSVYRSICQEPHQRERSVFHNRARDEHDDGKAAEEIVLLLFIGINVQLKRKMFQFINISPSRHGSCLRYSCTKQREPTVSLSTMYHTLKDAIKFTYF